MEHKILKGIDVLVIGGGIGGVMAAIKANTKAVLLKTPDRNTGWFKYKRIEVSSKKSI